MDRMSRFSKIRLSRSPIPSTATSAMTQAQSSSRITWLLGDKHKNGYFPQYNRHLFVIGRKSVFGGVCFRMRE